jgi:hypothetical protein
VADIPDARKYDRGGPRGYRENRSEGQKFSTSYGTRHGGTGSSGPPAVIWVAIGIVSLLLIWALV